MRKLMLSDVFKLSEIIDVMGIDLDFNELIEMANDKDGDTQENIGGEIAFKLVKKLYKAEQLVYEFISDISGDTVKEVKKYKMKQLVEFFTGLFNDEEFSDFFTQA